LLSHHVPAEASDKQKVLEAVDPVERLKLVVALLARRREVLKAAHDIESAVQEKVSKAEREHILRKKLEAIQNELGEGPASDGDELGKKIASLKLPDDVRTQVDKELARLKKLPEQSPERSVSRSWLQWIADLPWGVVTEDNLDVDNARQVLDADHHGLQKVKKRVLQFLAVRKLRGDLKGPILCLSGPPGVGKTSLGQTVARPRARKFVRAAPGASRAAGQDGSARAPQLHLRGEGGHRSQAPDAQAARGARPFRYERRADRCCAGSHHRRAHA